MAYVDLNPVRTAMALIHEDSDYKSIQERIKNKKSSLLNLGFGADDIVCIAHKLMLQDEPLLPINMGLTLKIYHPFLTD